MELKRIPLGQLQANCYVLCCEETDQAVVIDPGADEPPLWEALEGLRVREILATHAHWDHVSGAPALQARFDAPLHVHEAEMACLERWREEGLVDVHPDGFIADGQTIEVGSVALRVWHTPGHSPGHVVFLEDDYHWLFTGDLLIKNHTGGANVPGGNPDDFVQSINRLRELEGDWTVYPGHFQSTTLDEERQNNPYVKFKIKEAKGEDLGAVQQG